jgi:acyl carrier protein
MVPAHIIPVKWLPISSNGKADDKLMKSFFASLDIRTLGSLTRDTDRDSEEKAQIEDTIEEQLIQLISRISSLPQSDLGPNSHYFACGLDSLQLIRLSSGIHGEFGAIIPVIELMREPTVRKTAQLVRDMKKSHHLSKGVKASEQLDCFAQVMEQELASIRPLSEIQNIFPTFPVQEGALFSSLEDATQYVQHFVFRLHESVDLSRLQNAWKKTQGHLEILR